MRVKASLLRYHEILNGEEMSFWLDSSRERKRIVYVLVYNEAVRLKCIVQYNHVTLMMPTEYFMSLKEPEENFPEN